MMLRLAADRATAMTPARALSTVGILGELFLDGRVKPVRGALTTALAAARAGMERLIVPCEHATKATVIQGIAVSPMDTLPQVVGCLAGRVRLGPLRVDPQAAFAPSQPELLGFAGVKSQAKVTTSSRAKWKHIERGFDHNVLLLGLPGAGTSMRARRLTTIPPEMTLAEALDTPRLRRVAGRPGRRPAVVATRPCRAPRQPMADVGLIGGARCPCRARGRGPPMGSSASMSSPSADGMGLQGCGNR
jgi:magnesium chelatase family protein